MSFLLERDSINGKDGKAFIIDKNGETHQIFQLKKLNVDADFQGGDFVVTGTRIVQTLNSGLKYTGSMTVYYGSPLFLQMLVEYQNNRALPYFEIQVVNEDTTSTLGKQTITLRNCKLGKIPVAMLDADSDALEGQIDFSFTEIVVLNEFNAPASYGGSDNDN